MTLDSILVLLQNTLELGLISSLTVLALFLSYSMLNLCDLSTDGCYTLGAAVGAVVAMAGHPYLAIVAAMGAGVTSGFITAFLQTRMGVDSLLSGIIVNTALYSIVILIMSGKSDLNMFRTETIFTRLKALLAGTFLEKYYVLIIAIVAVVLVVIFLTIFLRTKLGLAIRATGNNPSMARSSSINPIFTTTVGLCIAGSLTALSGCLFAQSDKSVNVNLGSGILTVALASLLIGNAFTSKHKIFVRALGSVLGAFIFRLVYMIALRFNMPATMLKLVSSVIVVIAVSAPYLKKQFPMWKRRLTHNKQMKKIRKDGGDICSE